MIQKDADVNARAFLPSWSFSFVLAQVQASNFSKACELPLVIPLLTLAKIVKILGLTIWKIELITLRVKWVS
jgi:hypothetical protein